MNRVPRCRWDWGIVPSLLGRFSPHVRNTDAQESYIFERGKAKTKNTKLLFKRHVENGLFEVEKTKGL